MPFRDYYIKKLTDYFTINREQKAVIRDGLTAFGLSADKVDKTSILSYALDTPSSIANSTTFTEDIVTGTLTAPSSGVKTYRFIMNLLFSGPAAADFKFRITRDGLDAAELYYANNISSTEATSLIWDTETICSASGAGTRLINVSMGTLLIPSTSSDGTLALEWAQNTADVSATLLNRGSFIQLIRVN